MYLVLEKPKNQAFLADLGIAMTKKNVSAASMEVIIKKRDKRW